MDQLTQISVGGLFAIFVLREVFTFLKSRRTNGLVAGERSVEFWQQQHYVTISETLKTFVIPIMDKQTVILDEIRLSQSRLQLLLESQSRNRRSGD